MIFQPAPRERRKLLRCGAALLACIFTAACGNSSTTKSDYISSEGEPAPATFYLVRHAEKELVGDDPELSSAGYERANALAAELSGVKLDGIYSTDTRRTRDTAAPTLAQQGLDLRLYDGRALTALAEELLTLEGQYLVVGHSNTTPQLAEALGGEGGDPIVEADEYDRLYVLTRTGGIIITELRRFP